MPDAAFAFIRQLRLYDDDSRHAIFADFRHCLFSLSLRLRSFLLILRLLRYYIHIDILDKQPT